MAIVDASGMANSQCQRIVTAALAASRSLMSDKVALFLPSLEGGGAERVFVQLANQFASRGISVDLVLTSMSGPYLKEVTGNVKLVDLDSSSVVRSLPGLVRYLRQARPDVMLSGLDHANIVAILAKLIARVPKRCIVSMRSVPSAVYAQDKSVLRWVMLRLIGFSYPIADAVIANSTAVENDLVDSLHIRRKKIRVIYNPLDIKHIERQSNQAVDHPWLRANESPVIIAVGNLTAVKDFATLIRAFSIFRKKRDGRLVILGEGSARLIYEALISQLGLEEDVILPGFVDNPFPWLKRADVFVSSSLTEGCPNSLMQALACNTPVVSTNCIGGSAEILENGKWGTLVPVGDAEEMSRAILAVLDSGRTVNLKERAADFSHDTIVTQYLRVLMPNASSVDVVLTGEGDE